MTQVAIKDATGATQNIEAPNPNGRAAAASSKPVTLSNEDSVALANAAQPASGRAAAAASKPVALATEDLAALAQLPAGRAAAVSSRPVVLSTEDLAALVAPISAGEAHIGEVGGRTAVIAVPLTVTAAAYATGNVVGGKITFPAMSRLVTGTAALIEVMVQSKSAQTFPFDLVLFHSDPASTITDKTALAIGAADFDKLIGVVHGSDWTNLGTASVGQAPTQGRSYKVGAGTTIYGVLVARGAPTFASTSDLTVVLKALLD